MHGILVIVLFILGVFLVIRGGRYFVNASVAIAKRTNLPRTLVGGTLVSLATTAPEMAVSVTASIEGKPGLAIGNAVGSAIANIGLILGVLCLMKPFPVRKREFQLPSLVMLGTGILVFFLSLELRLEAERGAVLVAVAVAYIIINSIRQVRAGTGSEQTEEVVAGLGKSILMFFGGAVLVILGSRLLADNGVIMADFLRVPPMIVGLTLVAVGTSLPELVTATTSARMGVPDLSLGNVIGANIMNVTLIVGISAMIYPLEMSSRTQVYNFPAMIVMFVSLLIVAKTEDSLSRKEGIILLSIYILYIFGLVVVETGIAL